MHAPLPRPGMAVKKVHEEQSVSGLPALGCNFRAQGTIN